MTPLEEKIAHEINKMKLISSWQMTREAEDDIIYALRSIATQAVEEERKRILDEFPDFGFYNHKLHRHRWAKEGFNNCLTKVRNIISKPNI